MQVNDDDTVTLDQQGCARCTADSHDGMTFLPLTYPIRLGGEKLTHWAPCPTNGEPILLLVSEKEEL